VYHTIEKKMTAQEQRQQLYDTMEVRQQIRNGNLVLINNVPAIIERKVGQMKMNQSRYETVAHRFVNPGLKWWLVALTHEMECSQNFNCYLGNGQPWNKITTWVPVGRGPFASFEDGAVDALQLKGADRITDWSIGNVLFFLEGYNGYGYSRYKGINSPYLWSGSNHYTKGKYVSDGAKGWNAEAVSQQIGIALLMKQLLAA
jgi:lysozyme family protein